MNSSIKVWLDDGISLDDSKLNETPIVSLTMEC